MSLSPEPMVAGEHGPRATDEICQRLDERRFRVDGRELSVPLEIPACSLLVHGFSVDAAAAQGLLEGTGLRAARVLPGKGLLLLLGVDYRDNPLGDYNEAAVLIAANPPDAKDGGARPVSWLSGALDAALMHQGYYVYRMPVDQEFTAHAGRFLWGYPKYLATIDVDVEDRQARARLCHGSELVFEIETRARDAGRLRERHGRNITCRGGQLQEVIGSVSGEGLWLRPGGPPPLIGEHDALAQQLRSLGLPKRPLFRACLKRARMRFGAAQPIPRRPQPGSTQHSQA